MSYDISIYFGTSTFPEAEYRRFVRCCTLIHGRWNLGESSPLDLAAEWKAHECWLHNNPDALEGERVVELSDDDLVLRVGLTLHPYTERVMHVPPDRFKWIVSVETGAGRNPLSLGVQLLAPAVAFRTFTEVVVEDIQSGLDGPQVFEDLAAYSAHVLRVARAWKQFTKPLTRLGFLSTAGGVVLPEIDGDP